jgi:hypothetical protein
MPKRSRKSNQGCCLFSLVLWPFQLLENLVNSLNLSGINQKHQPTPRKKVKSRTVQKGENAGRFVDVIPAGTQKFVPSFGVSITYENRGISFVNEAQKFRNKSATSADHVPFKCYWPTYRDMNDPQQQWYFYWRSQIRRDNYLPTDLSYIFVHTYEILNLVETPDPGQAAARIRSLWLTYRETYPNLDRYLPDWAGDLVAVKVGTPQALEWWATMMSIDGLIIPNSVINTMVENALQTNALEVLPYKIWSLISNYQPKNKFYQKHNTNRSIDLAYGKAIMVANSYYL